MADLQTMNSKELLCLLSQPPPENFAVEQIDFTQLGLHGYEGHSALLIHNALSAEECQLLLQGAEESNQHRWDQALLNIGYGRQTLNTDIRLCDRIILDDTEIAAKIMARILPSLPADIVTLKNASHITGPGPGKRQETWRISRMNERLRFLKYTKGMYFRPHCDGSYSTPGGEEITWLTVHLYLNGTKDTMDVMESTEDAQKPLIGGSTRFFGRDETEHWDLEPEKGSVLVFQHRHLFHSGEDVVQGTKYTMRSDILYRKLDKTST